MKHLIALAKITPLSHWFSLILIIVPSVLTVRPLLAGCSEVLPLPVRAARNRKSSPRQWPQIMFSHSAFTLSSFLSALSPPPNWLPVRTASCRMEREDSDYKAVSLEHAGGCTVCQAEPSKEAWGSIWVDYWLFPSPPSLSVFLSASSPLVLLMLLYSFLPGSSAKAMDGKRSPGPLDKLWSFPALEKLKCLSQLLDMKGFGGSIRLL